MLAPRRVIANAIVVFFLLGAGPYPRVDAADGDLRSRVVAEFPTALAKMEARFASASGSGRHVIQGGIGTSKPETWENDVVFARVPGRKMMHSKRVSPAPKPGGRVETVRCWNGTHAFVLTRTQDQPQLLVTYFGTDHSGIDLAFMMNVERYLMASHSVFEVPFSRIWSHPSFKLLEVKGLQEGGREIIRVAYDYHPSNMILRSGWIKVVPEDGWAILEYESQTNLEGVVVSSVVEYGEKQGEVAIPKRVFVKTGSKSADSFDFEELVLGPVPESRFTLAAFGLPELGLPAPPPRNVAPYWAFGGAAIALLAALILRRYAARGGMVSG
jgi:hypothetical protein